MTPSEAVVELDHALSEAGLEDTRIQSEVLVMHLLNMDRAHLYRAWAEEIITQHSQQSLQNLLKRRLAREPLAYIIGKWEFFGLEFIVDQRVLIPRPETELLVEHALEITLPMVQNKDICTIADIGTGSGAIAISLGIYIPNSVIYATDISQEALEVAQNNCDSHGLTERIQLLRGDLLNPIVGPVDLIISNPPYVRDGDLDLRAPELEHEPEIAFKGGPQGLDLVMRLLTQSITKLAPGGSLLIEVSPSQARVAQEHAAELFPRSQVDLICDLAGWNRALHIKT